MKIITDITHTRGYLYEDNNGYNSHQRLSV
jgi:hypothetical protein